MNSEGFGSRLYRPFLTKSFRMSGSNVEFVAASRFLKRIIETLWVRPSVVISPLVAVEHSRELVRHCSGKKTSHTIFSIGRFAQSKNHIE